VAEFVKVTDAAAIGEELAAFKVKGTRIAIANSAGSFHAFDDTCNHLPCSLAEGKLEEAA
jgi:nitrite reductase/ring-hydroxylating ferredoxin subunit